MFSALCRRLLPLALGTGFVFAAAPAFSALGDTASSQARHIATVFPGRMTGTPPEMLSADYLRQQFALMGYQSDVRSFNTRYIYTDSNQRKNWHNATGSTVIAAHEGKVRQQIIIMAHLDTYAPQSDKDVENNLGGLTLQGIDDNAMGLGVLLELAEHLKNVPTRYGIRFIATSGEEEGRLGAQNLLQRMSEAEKKNTLLVINLDNLVVGDKLYFNSGRSTPASVRKLTRDRALAIARSKGIAAYTNPGLNPAYPKGTSHGRQPYREPSTVSPPQQGQRFSLESSSSTIVSTSRFASLPTAAPNLSRPQSEPLLLRSRPSRSRFRPSCSSARF